MKTSQIFNDFTCWLVWNERMLAHWTQVSDRCPLGYLLAHLSRRPLVVRRRRPHSLNIFSSETTGPIKVKFHMELLWDGGTKVCSNVPGHMTKMVAMPIYGKNLKKSSSLEPKRPMTLKLGIQHWVLEYYQICSNDDLELTWTYFTTRSNLIPYAFVWEKGKTMNFSETIVVYDVKVGRCS